MATKGQIVEQVLRIVNGGDISDDNKISMQEVGALLDQERDALVKKTVMENAVIGEQELPYEFLSQHRLLIQGDRTYSNMPKAYVNPPETINLPNDGGIYRVCRVANKTSLKKVDTYQFNFGSYNLDNGSPLDVGFSFELKTGGFNIGKKFTLYFKHGGKSTSLSEFQFTFDYLDYDSVFGDATMVTEAGLKPSWLVFSMLNNEAFNQFLQANRLTCHYSTDNTQPGQSDIGVYDHAVKFISHDQPQSFGTADSMHFDIKSVLTGASVIEMAPSMTIASNWSQGTTNDAYPTNGQTIQIWYHKNHRLRNMEADPLGVKGKGSSFLNFHLELTQAEMKSGKYGAVSAKNLCKMFLNKFGYLLHMYGIAYTYKDHILTLREMEPLGGFDDMTFPQLGEGSNVFTQSLVTTENSERSNYNVQHCYHRMPNAGVHSNLYDDAILLSGRRYWYRQEGKLYLYKEDFQPEISVGDTESEAQDRESYLMVWLLARSRSIGWTQNFPVPADMEAEIIKSLVATFTMMRTAKEDNINDNVDAT